MSKWSETADGKRSRGLLLSFEGIDASGKNTQSAMLLDFLRTRGIQSEYLSFPVYSTHLGQEIAAFLSNKKEYNVETRHLLYAANRYEFKDKIERWLEDGIVVVANRYCESNLAYGVANGLPIDWLRRIESLMPQADYIFLLKATSSLSQSRKTERDKYEANLELLNRVSEVYDSLIEKGRWFTVRAGGSVDSIHYEISKLAVSLLEVSNEVVSNLKSGVG
ncbi:MAG: dTMP kinase [Nitrososphaerales archaeon]